MSEQVLQPGTRRVVLPSGGVAFVRTVSRSQMVRLMGAVGYRAEQTHSVVALGMITQRWSLVGLENTTGEDGKPVEFVTVKHSTLGPIAAEAVYDSLRETDIDAINNSGTSKLEEQRPN